MAMRRSTRLQLAQMAREDDRGQRLPGRKMEFEYERWDEPTRMGYDEPENRFRDRRGREHYDNGRFAPMRDRMDETVDDVEPENRGYPRRRDETFAPRSFYEDDQGSPRMGQIGFDVKSMGEHEGGNVVTMPHHRKKMTREMADEWMNSLRNEDGSSGPKWSMEEVKRVMKQKGLNEDLLTFWVVINSLYSDYGSVLKKHNASTVDLYADLACAWINDKDAVKDKVETYYAEIVKH